MNGQRAVFERATLAQRLLLFRQAARSKRSNHMTAGLGFSRCNSTQSGAQIGFGQSMNRCSTAKRRAR
ncbi:hypothetical protein FW789_18030 [Pseudomonas sp. 1121_17]